MINTCHYIFAKTSNMYKWGLWCKLGMWVIVTCQCRFIKCKVWWASSISGGCACVGTRVQISVTSGHFCWEPKTAIKCSLLIFFLKREAFLCVLSERKNWRFSCYFVAVIVALLLFVFLKFSFYVVCEKKKKGNKKQGFFIEQPHQNFRMLMIKKVCICKNLE